MLAYNCRSGPLEFTNSAKLHLGYDGWYNKEKQVRVWRGGVDFCIGRQLKFTRASNSDWPSVKPSSCCWPCIFEALGLFVAQLLTRYIPHHLPFCPLPPPPPLPHRHMTCCPLMVLHVSATGCLPRRRAGAGRWWTYPHQQQSWTLSSLTG